MLRQIKLLQRRVERLVTIQNPPYPLFGQIHVGDPLLLAEEPDEVIQVVEDEIADDKLVRQEEVRVAYRLRYVRC